MNKIIDEDDIEIVAETIEKNIPKNLNILKENFDKFKYNNNFLKIESEENNVLKLNQSKKNLNGTLFELKKINKMINNYIPNEQKSENINSNKICKIPNYVLEKKKILSLENIYNSKEFYFEKENNEQNNKENYLNQEIEKNESVLFKIKKYY